MTGTAESRTARICTGCEEDTETTLYVGSSGRIYNYCPSCRDGHGGRLETLR